MLYVEPTGYRTYDCPARLMLDTARTTSTCYQNAAVPVHACDCHIYAVPCGDSPVYRRGFLH
eukprot:scaffold476240_cov43-Prasinocladus_malaysianus.AAC.2